MESNTAVTVLSALAQETRLSIFRFLVKNGAKGIAVGQMGEQLGIPPATLSFHLKELSHAGLLQSEQKGRFIYYTANFAAMGQLLAYLTENCCAGSSCSPKA